MVVQTQSRERIFSILNDNDCPSFAVRPRPSSPAPASLSSKTLFPSSPRVRHERPTLPRLSQYTRSSSISSIGSPPLLRHSSASSKASSESMENSPSPLTPVYSYNDSNMVAFDAMMRQDLPPYLPSPTTITPFMDQQLLITATGPDQFTTKPIAPLTASPFAIASTPVPVLTNGVPNIPHLPTPVSSNGSVPPPPISTAAPAASAKASPSSSGTQSTGKKNKYPCPYAASHNCLATFTTSGHAARHGKKHTGEKGVHCPVCNKAFTRKDNMKQHERTHKNSTSGSNSDESTRRSKAAITKDAQKDKQRKVIDQKASEASRRSSLIHSPLSEVTSLAPTGVDTPLNAEEPHFFPDPPQMLVPIPPIPENVSPSSLYPPLSEDLLLGQTDGLASLDKLSDLNAMNPVLMPPTLIRGFSDLDTLAQAAETFDPYYHPTL